MRILVVAATAAEIAPLASRSRSDINILITGVGMVAAAAWTSRELARERYDLALNLGVCGSFTRTLQPGAVVHVVSDCLAELGAEDGDRFLTIQQMRLLGDNEFPFEGGRLVNASPPRNRVLDGLRAVHGITVNTVHGNERSIACVTERVTADVESMEGAGFMYACLIHRVPFAQVRAVSNIVERRNREAWRLDLAIAELNTVAGQLLES